MHALRSNSSVQTLSARHNKLGNLTAGALATTLAANTTLRDLCLSWNALGANAGAAIARGLGSNQGLQVRSPLASPPFYLLAPGASMPRASTR